VRPQTKTERANIMNKTITYKEAVQGYDLVLMNSIAEIDPSIYENIVAGSLDAPCENCDACKEGAACDEPNQKDIYQYYAMGVGESAAKFINDYYPELIIAYSNKLDSFFLLVDHYGTSWGYVNTIKREC